MTLEHCLRYRVRACQTDGNILSAEAKYRPRTWESRELQHTKLSCPSPSPGVCSGKGWETAVLFFRLEKWEGPDYRNLSTRLHSLDAHLRKDFRSLSLQFLGFPGGSDGKNLPAMQIGFDWVGKIPWRRTTHSSILA